ncbi:MAG: ribonuclease R [Nitrospinaceae bacterium]|nr:MAG: ribonuclease R [Nitrospinaceae bacterium]
MKLTEETILKLLRNKANRPMKVSELVKQFKIPDVQRREFRSRLKEMAADGRVIKIRGGRYGLPDEMNLVSGILTSNPKGFGFVVQEKDRDQPDIYVNRTHRGDAMHGDLVAVRIESGKDRERPEGRVIRILKRNTTSLVGTYEQFGRDGWVIPMDAKYVHDVFVAGKSNKGAKTGHIVSVTLESFPSKHQPPVGRVTEVLGFSDDPEVEVKAILRKFGVAAEFPQKVLNSAEKAAHADLMNEEMEQRTDLSDELIFTVDGEKAKDFDDAVSIEKMGDGYRLGVHIADVSHFVREDSPLDKEAFQRGTSIYYPDSVVPMLPFQLSNEICSLKPDEKRLTLSVLIDYDAEGHVVGRKIFNSIIESKKRFTYTEVAHLLETGDPKNLYKEILPTLKIMGELSQILRKNRFRQGSVDFNLPEPEVQMNEKGKIERIVMAEHNVAHEMVEEFMLAANQVVARFLFDKNVPSIHRIHEPPDDDKIAEFNEFILSFGIKLKTIHKVPSVDLQNLLKRIKNHPEERTINTLLLRTMKKAVYSAKDPGHYCLGFKYYTHFTSPIRRYPDLITHRLVKTFLHKRKCSQRENKRLLPKIAEFADQSSAREQNAMAIEREVNDLRRAQFMADKIGNVYSGLIISVTAFGFFVELSEVYVEGLVKISSIGDDYYNFIETEHKWQGQRRHRTFKIGDTVKVRVDTVDIARRQIGLILDSK